MYFHIIRRNRMEQLKLGSINLQKFPLTIRAMSNSASAAYVLQQLTSRVDTETGLDFVFDMLSTRGCTASFLGKTLQVSFNCQ